MIEVPRLNLDGTSHRESGITGRVVVESYAASPSAMLNAGDDDGDGDANDALEMRAPEAAVQALFSPHAV